MIFLDFQVIVEESGVVHFLQLKASVSEIGYNSPEI